MIYTPQIKKAMTLAYNAHHGQNDKNGQPYIFHPFYLAMQMESEKEIVTALLHDVCEDTSITFEDLEKEGFDKDIIDALQLLCRKENEDYMDYIKRLKDNSLARSIKLQDLKHNSMLERLDSVTEKDIARSEKYKEAMQILEQK